ncbi:hypothetical protein DNTS_001991 [Danionella cerebrum]|uniref:Armadillo repeat-containing domain-containing protein n=1 Tax=Danionella cerebrum TaxID=2873325 RepID=A0A553RAI2_9TELE|nr:hypothetical protein DNTS_001991 [Danionella translucida]
MFLMELKQEKSEHFYIRRQTSAEIVSEARRSLRTLATQRPFTPLEKHRRLFGESSSRSHDGRPPSSFSLHAKHFEAPDSRPGSGTRLSPLEHKARVSLSLDEDSGDNKAVLPKPPAERGSSRSGGSRSRLIKVAPTNKQQTFPNPTSDAVSDEIVGQLCNSCRGLHEALEERGMLGRQCKKRSTILRTLFRLVDVGSDRLNLTLAHLILAGRKEGLEEMTKERMEVKKEGMDWKRYWREGRKEGWEGGNGVRKEGREWGKEERKVKKEGSSEGMEGGKEGRRDWGCMEGMAWCKEGKERLHVSGNNLLNICKLLFKISRSPNNDTLFLSSSILDSLVSLLDCEDVWSKGEAVLYCVGSLKLLSGNSALSRLLLEKSFIAVLLRLSKRLLHGPLQTSANGTSHGSEGEGQHVVTGHILVQVADQSESRPSFLSNKAFSALCLILENHRNDLDICLNVARIFSKLSTYTECCHALAETRHCCGLFLELLAKHSRKQELVVRLLFTLGNLAAKSSEARERVYEEEGGIEVLLNIFQIYQEPPSTPKRSRSPESEDILVKLLRLLANLAIHPTVGTALAAHPLYVQLLLEVLESRSVEENEEIVINAVATINNLSFYSTQSSVLRSQPSHISQLLLKLLLTTSMDAVLEATLEQFVITLLDSKSPDVCFSACGVLINLSADPELRAKLKDQEIIHKLLECLRDLGHQDWHLAAVLCQTLWNCSSDGELQHSQELLEILQLYSDRGALLWPSDAGGRQVQEACWELLFLPVAERLKQHLNTQVSTDPVP